MIITRTPFRISFFGGGTDYPAWYRENGGAVLSTTIDKYCYVSARFLPPYFKYKYLLRYIQREETGTVDEIKHPVVREALKMLGVTKGIEMIYAADIPAQSGVGSSSAFSVGFLHALYALMGKMSSKRQLGREAMHLEQDILKENVGSQDQVAAAFGGFNRIEFGGAGEFYVSPITIPAQKLHHLQDNLILFFTGFTRNANEIAAEQVKNTPSRKAELTEMRAMVDSAVSILNGPDHGYKDFGKLLHEGWRLKKMMSGSVTTGQIDDIYERGLKAGALGGKLIGAGGGGFMLFYADPSVKYKIKEALKGVLHVPFAFENLGSQVILYSRQETF
ncbi:MAG: kinase [Nitrospinae bacterium]|nr:kinase [Nitrospinota bacterium]